MALCRGCLECYRNTTEEFDIHEHDNAAVDHESFGALSRGKPGLVGARRSAAVRDDGSGKDGDGEGVRKGRERNDHHGLLLLPWCRPVRFVHAPRGVRQRGGGAGVFPKTWRGKDAFSLETVLVLLGLLLSLRDIFGVTLLRW